jgi:guanylate kinase
MRVNDHEIRRRGCLFIVSGPSGAGKTSICRPVLSRVDNLALSVSFTTRKPRGGEGDGVEYRFVDDTTFDEMVAAGEFAEWAEVHGYRYGTSRVTVERARASGRDLLLDIDVQGAAQLKGVYPEAVAVFLLPPSADHLERRLVSRGTEAPDTVRKRLQNACREIAQIDRYDYAIVNEDLNAAVEGLMAIIAAERLRVGRIRHADLDVLVRAFGERT